VHRFRRKRRRYRETEIQREQRKERGNKER
jgi:hypothetical protein